MKETFLIVGVIAAGILVIVLLLNQSPDLLSYDFKSEDKYNNVNNQVIPDLKLSIVTSEPSFWEQVAKLNKKETTAPSNEPTTVSTDENGNEIPQIEEIGDKNINTNADGTPVTTVPK